MRAAQRESAGGARQTASRAGWVAAGLAILSLLAALSLFVMRSVGDEQSGVMSASARPLATLRTADFHALVLHPTDPQVAFFGHHNGVMRTGDGGRTWRPLVARSNFDGMGLAVDQSDPQTVYLAGHDIFQVSTDGGTSWRPASHNLPGTDIHGFAASPADPARLYAFVVGYGLFRSADRGATWQSLGKVPPDVMSIAAAGGTPETLYAGSMRVGLLRSDDGGQSWAPAGGGLSGAVLTIAVDRIAPQNVYAGTERGLYKSMDAGKTWRALPFPGQNAMAAAVSPARPGRVLAISVQGGEGLVYRSDDGGESWRPD